MVGCLIPFEALASVSESDTAISAVSTETGDLIIEFDEIIDVRGDINLDLWRVDIGGTTYKPVVQPTVALASLIWSVAALVSTTPDIADDTLNYAGFDPNLLDDEGYSPGPQLGLNVVAS